MTARTRVFTMVTLLALTVAGKATVITTSTPARAHEGDNRRAEWRGSGTFISQTNSPVMVSGTPFSYYLVNGKLLMEINGAREITWEYDEGANGYIRTTENGVLMSRAAQYFTTAPEPATLGLFGLGIVGVAGVARYKAKR